MSYGLKYISYAKGLSQNTWRVEFEEKNYTPSEGSTPTQITLTGEGVRIGYDREDDRFNLIYSRYVELSLKVTSNFNISTLQFDDERKYKVKIYKDNVIEFVGWLIPSFPSQEFEDDTIATFKVMAKDTLNQLKQIKFVNENPTDVTNKDYFTNLIAQCLRQTGIQLNFEIYYNKYENGMSKTINDCPLNQLTCDVTSFKDTNGEYYNYYEVLEILLQEHDLKLIQAEGKWIIYSQIELVDGSIVGRTYNYLGVKITNKTVNTDKDIHTNGLKVVNNTQIRKDIPLQQVSAIYNVGEDENLVANGDLDSFSAGIPLNWNLSSNWNSGEISANAGGGIIIDNTFLSRPSGISPDAPITETSLNPSKYIESDPINIAGLNSFKLSAELYADSDIDTIRIRIEMYLGTTRKYYVDRYGKIARSATSIYVDKGDTDIAKMLDISWKNESDDFSVEYVDTMKIRIYPGVRLRSGDPSRMMVKYRNISITGTPIFYDTDYIGRKWEYTNTNLPTSKKQESFNIKFQDFGIFPSREKRHKSKLYLSDKTTQTKDWKRTSESTNHTLVESILIDRLAITSKYGDIIEGSVYGYIGLFDTLTIDSTNQRFLVLWSEYSLQSNQSEIYITELYATSVNTNIKIYDLFQNDKIVDVSSSGDVTTININETFDPPITQNGGVIHGVLYPDGGIDALPIDTTNPRAGNKGILIFGANYAEGIQLGNKNNQTLVEVLGGKLNIGDSKLYSYNITTGDDEVFVGLGIDSHEFQVDGRIMAVGGVEVGQGGVWITKQMTPEGLIYGQITAETAITVNSPIVNFPTQIYIKEVGGIGENPVQFNTQVEFNQPIFITESSDPRSAVTKQQLETAVADLTLGEFGQYLDSNENPNIFDAPYGASYVAGLLTNLPNGMYKGHSIKMAIGQDKPNEATYMAFGLPRDDFDGKIYLRGIYENGEVDTGWKAVGGDIQNFTIYRNEAEIQRLGYYYEIDKGDQNVFVGFDKTNGDFEIAMMIADSESVIVTEARTVMRAEDGRLCYQFGNNEPVKYALSSEVGTGAAIAYSGQSPISVDGTLIKIQVANGSQNGYLSSADWTTFNNKQNALSNASSTVSGILTNTDWTAFNNKLGQRSTIESTNFLNFASGSALFFGQDPTDIYTADARINVYDKNGVGGLDLVLYTMKDNSDIILITKNSKVIMQRVEVPASTSTMFTEVEIGNLLPNSIININGTNFNWKLNTTPTNGQKFLVQYDSSKNTFFFVPA